MAVGRYPLGIMEEEPVHGLDPLLGDGAEGGPFRLLRAGFEALDFLNIGLAVIAGSGQLLLANRTAEQVLAARDGLELSPRGILQIPRSSASGNTNLTPFARPSSSSLKAVVSDRVLPVPRSDGKRPLTLLVRSTRAASSRADSTSPAALVFILDPDHPVIAAESELRQLYGLTLTEARMANLLMTGKTLDDCCRELDIRRSTARTHLQHLFEKTGVQRQSELVFLLLKSVGMVSATGAGQHSPSNPRTPSSAPEAP